MSVLKKIWPALLLLAVAAVFIGIGLLQAQHQDVLKKATTICMECIGLG
ncbi:MAG: hypothetical protein IJP03_06160 [Christensenellaceae bacterium]|nr:hypothetical protein [Christensenellaceae bacterium]